jgi:hypothetical protein
MRYSPRLEVSMHFIKSTFVFLSLYFCLSAIEIPQDTVFSFQRYKCGDSLIITNTSADTITIDSIAIRQLSSTTRCWEIAQQSTNSDTGYFWNYWWDYMCLNCRANTSATFGVASPFINSKKITIKPFSSSITNCVSVGNGCIYCVSTGEQPDQCQLMATFIPNKGTRDSVVIIGQLINTSIQSIAKQNIPARKGLNFKTFDLRGKIVGRSERLSGVYLCVDERSGHLQLFTSKSRVDYK